MTIAVFRKKSLASQVAALFANGEQGLWYDIEGLRDAWNAVGPELVTNSGFDSGLSGWTTIGGSTQSVSSGLLTISGGGASGGVYQDIATTANYLLITVHVRRVSGTGNGAVGGVPRTGGFASPNSQLTVSTTVAAAPSTLSFLLQREPTASGVRVYVQAVGGDGVFEVDSVSVREWLGSGATALYQDAAGSMPTYLPGQGQIDPPVGLLLDRRAGLAKGAELVANSGFDVDLSGWAQSIAGYWQWSAGRAYHPLGSNYADLTMAVTTTPGWVVVEFDYTVITGSGSAQWFYVNAAGVGVTNASGGLPLIPTGSGRFRYVIRDGIRKIGFSRNTSAEFYVDNVTVRPLFGNHAYQTTTASRPTLSARYNLLTSTDTMSDTNWQLGTAWSATVGDTAPDGSPTAVKITSLTAGAATSRVVIATASQLKFVIYTRPGSYSPTVLVRNNTTATALVTCTQVVGVVNTAYGQGAVSDAGGGWRKIVVTITAGVTVGDAIGLYYGATGSVASGLYWWVWHPDFRVLNDGVGSPDYQRVVDINNYDTNNFPLYLRLDGVDDWMLAPGLDLSAEPQAMVAFAIRKLSDAVGGELLGFSATPNASSGAFGVLAPPGAGSPRTEVSAFGSANGYAQIASTSPESAVYVALLNLGVPTVADGKVVVRKNGAAAVPVVTGPGAGTASLGNYALYLFRRGGTSFPFSGRFYGLLIRGGAISDGQISRVERLMNQKAKVF